MTPKANITVAANVHWTGKKVMFFGRRFGVRSVRTKGVGEYAVLLRQPMMPLAAPLVMVTPAGKDSRFCCFDEIRNRAGSVIGYRVMLAEMVTLKSTRKVEEEEVDDFGNVVGTRMVEIPNTKTKPKHGSFYFAMFER